MHQFSDSESSDSEDGIRFKTDSTRNKQTNRSRRRDNKYEEAESSKRRHRETDNNRDLSRSYKRSSRRSPDGGTRRSRRRRSRDTRRHHRRRSRSRSSKREEPKIKHCDAISSSDDEDILNRREEEILSRKVDEEEKEQEQPEKEKVSNELEVEEFEVSNTDIEYNKDVDSEEGKTFIGDAEEGICGPALPPSMCGPLLPPHLRVNKITEDTPKCIGPTLPPHLRKKLEEDTVNETPITEIEGKLEHEEGELEADVAITGDKNDEDDDDDDGCYGPLPPDLTSNSLAHRALEERALQMKLDQLNGGQEEVNGREEWMIELPSAVAKYGLGPRQFKARAGPDLTDRSSWTDTPQNKRSDMKDGAAVNDDLKQEAELAQVRKRDQEQEDMIRKHKKQKKKEKEKSLLEQHQDKIKKRKKKEREDGSANVRRPFNRDIDLKVNHFDEAQKKAIMKKAQLLDDRFSKGQSKFL
ncbi:PREDICTED: GPALPP motifs-containing protein 1 [Nicrophorus vespilloides]|uniref:GPALPP motifs-containing protein 1 n=1 Tax=Nicrophorus vespilloides TaxID=110193 RepID=A0ABM1M5L1_NICVS|nr:PREDICTED: GPALPP motifs-containing protein 1 [Nicrophorus vespilloides]